MEFVLIGEGTSDLLLLDSLLELASECGALQASGSIISNSDFSQLGCKTLEEKVALVAKLEPQTDVVIIHRDSDSANPEERRSEIESVKKVLDPIKGYLPLVPIQETEAWLLLDEDAIRRAAGKPRGTANLDLPTPQRVEQIASPKEFLSKTLNAASELSGRKLLKFKKSFPQQRAFLLRTLTSSGPQRNTRAWTMLAEDMALVVRKCQDGD